MLPPRFISDWRGRRRESRMYCCSFTGSGPAVFATWKALEAGEIVRPRGVRAWVMQTPRPRFVRAWQERRQWAQLPYVGVTGDGEALYAEWQRLMAEPERSVSALQSLAQSSPESA
jgi:hypothetical protein